MSTANSGRDTKKNISFECFRFNFLSVDDVDFVGWSVFSSAVQFVCSALLFIFLFVCLFLSNTWFLFCPRPFVKQLILFGLREMPSFTLVHCDEEP